MKKTPKIAPLNIQRDIYGLWDERGILIGTGTREVCEVLLYLITQPMENAGKMKPPEVVHPQMNVRAAISI